MTLKEMREKLGKLAKDIRAHADLANDEKRQWTAEDEQTWTRLNGEYDGLKKRVDLAARAEEVETSLQTRTQETPGREDRTERTAPIAVTEEHRALAIQAWCRHQAGLDLEPRHEEAVKLCRVNPRRNRLDIAIRGDYHAVRREFRATNTTAAGLGGDTIPQGFVNQFELAMLAIGGLRNVCTVMRTASGNQLDWPTADDTGNEGEMMTEATSGSSQEFTTSMATLDAYKFGSKMIKVSAELLEDSAFNLASFLSGIMGERLARIINTRCTTGDGSSKPHGIVIASTLGVTTASPTVITWGEIIDLIHSVDPSYRSAAFNCGFMCHDSIILALRKLKSKADEVPIWQPSLQLGTPDRLAGWPLEVNQAMGSTVTATTKVMLFGAFSKYVIREAGTLRVRRLVERYADEDVEGYIAFLRADGELIDAGTHPVKYMQMHS